MHYFFACKGLLNDDVGMARANVFRDVRPRAVGAKKTDISFKNVARGGYPYNDSSDSDVRFKEAFCL